MKRILIAIIFAMQLIIPSSAKNIFPALSGSKNPKILTVYSSLDEIVSTPLIKAFQKTRPGIEVHYYDLQSLDIYNRVITETDKEGSTADLVISSAMDLQVKLANDGYARELLNPVDDWPEWAKWRNSAFGLTFEPSVIVYHKPSFAEQPPPKNRTELTRLLTDQNDKYYGRSATYDIERSGLGFLFLARDTEHERDIWKLVAAMGAAGIKLYSNSSAILERVADGRLAVGYNILGSYAENWAIRNPDLGITLPQDFTVVMSRIALVPKAALQPDLGDAFLTFLMSEQGQKTMANKVRLPALHPAVTGPNTAVAMRKKFGARLRPITIGSGLVVYLDQATRARFLIRWNRALRGGL